MKKTLQLFSITVVDELIALDDKVKHKKTLLSWNQNKINSRWIQIKIKKFDCRL